MSQCPTCGSNISDDAPVCPDCGMDLRSTSSQPTSAVVSLPETSAPKVVLDQNPPVPEPLPVVKGACLILKRGGVTTAEKFTFGQCASIGRFDPESGPVDVDMGPLPEAVYVSRLHAEVRCVDGEWTLRDIGSRNGTFVRDSEGKFQRVTDSSPLKDGDEISLGNAHFEFHVDKEP